MNNYLYANLATGKISKGISGGGQSGNLPTFIIGEENKFNLYFLDFPKPSTYPSPALGDNFFYEPKTQVINTDITIRAGTKIGEYIINETIAANANNLDRTISGIMEGSGSAIFKPTAKATFIPGGGVYDFSGVVSVIINGIVSTSGPTPVEGALGPLPYYFSSYEIQQVVQKHGDTYVRANYFPLAFFEPLSNNPTLISQNFGRLIYTPASATAFPIIPGVVTVIQTGDYSYTFNYQNSFSYQMTGAAPVAPNSPGSPGGNSSLLGPAGKYGLLNFNSPDWNAIIGSNEEATIWVEIVIANQVVAQGSAILRKRLTS